MALFIVVAIVLLVAAPFAPRDWGIPLAAGAVASLVAALYQRWWVLTNFPAAPVVTPERPSVFARASTSLRRILHRGTRAR